MTPTRHRLPTTRRSITQKRTICDYEVYVTVGFYDDGTGDGDELDRHRPGEVFAVVAKHGSDLGGLLDTVAMLISVSLQYGVPWSALESKLRHVRFGGGNDPAHTSIVDGLAQAVSELVEAKRKAGE